MHRFFIPPEAIRGEEVFFPPDSARQIAQVLRLRPGQQVAVLDNRGGLWVVELATVSAKETRGRILTQSVAEGEPLARVQLYLCLTQREKFEWMLQKCTEIGAAEFTPVISSRSLAQDAADVEHKLPRWNKIVQEAAEQCGRGHIPVIRPALRWEPAVHTAVSEAHLSLVLWEQEHQQPLRDALAGLPAGEARVALFIGPEGGLSEAEVQFALVKGARAVTLGKRILRMETAAVVGTALALYELGEMG